MNDETPCVTLRPWSGEDFWILERANTPEMTEHLGGPESREGLVDRHERYLRTVGGSGRMYAIETSQGGESAGVIGFWARTWREEQVYEAGWGVLPEYQGRGLAVAAARAVIAEARRQGDRRRLHAFPGVDHPASNAVCRRAGFTLLGECLFEYPKGHLSSSNDWAVELHGTGVADAGR